MHCMVPRWRQLLLTGVRIDLKVRDPLSTNTTHVGYDSCGAHVEPLIPRKERKFRSLLFPPSDVRCLERERKKL